MNSPITLSQTNERNNTVAAVLHDLWSSRPSRKRYVSLRELPDHLKRDIGLLDGSRPVGSVRW